MSLFADPEVEEYLAACELAATVELVAFVQGLARGVPFAVQLVTEAMRKLGPEKVRQEFPPVDPAEYSPQEMVTEVTRRFLRYCLDNEQDEERLRALAMMRRRDDTARRVVWQLADAERPRQLLANLEARYSFLQSDGTMHEVVRQFLRDSLRGDDRETAVRLGALLSQHYRQQWQAETDRTETLEDLLAEERWRTLTLDTLNALCWHEEDLALPFLVQRSLEALIFRPSFALSLLKLGAEFRQAKGWWRSQTSRHFDTVSQAVTEQGPVAVAALQRLGQAKHSLKLEQGHECLLLLAQARQIEQLAVQLAPDQASYHNGLGAMLFMIKGANYLSLTQDAFTQAITHNPYYAQAYSNRGNTYYELADYQAALADFSQAIIHDPHYAQAYSNRGLTYAKLANYQAALTDYSQAIAHDPHYALAFYNRGNTYYELANYQAALTNYSQAIQLDPIFDPPVYNIACVYALMGEVEQACHWLRQAIMMNRKNMGIL